MPHVTPAIQTMIALDTAMRRDQGGAFRQWEQKVLPHLDDAYRGEDEPFRGHLGASVLGDECGRAIWYGFRWATRQEHSGQLLRLFNRGHLEEGRFIAALLTAGVQVVQQDQSGKQYRISFAEGHAGGSGDGFVTNVPDFPEKWAALECKTHNQKSFDELAGANFRKWFDGQCGRSPKVAFEGKGVREAKKDHFFQMQTYMRKFGVPLCLYVAVNKNTDDIYMEVVTLDAALADQLMVRAERIIWMHEPPEKMRGASAGWFACKWCNHNGVCHQGKTPDRNCRTCGFSEPVAGGEGKWICKHPKHVTPVEIDRKQQLAGCEGYVKHRQI